MSVKVIVFGPTGNIGCITAIAAQEHGAEVYLGMRDPQKDIAGLSKEDEQKGGFKRVQADLTKPDTITEAVKSSGATRAFVYCAMGSQDHMRSSIVAMKAAGIDFVIFLSSSTVQGDLKSIPPSEIIEFMHAQVELVLDDVYGPDHYVAVRPGRFATNFLRQKSQINAGEVKIFGGKWLVDCITNDDMGQVSGAILAEGPKEGQQKVFLYGPDIMPQEEAIRILVEALGKDVKITEATEQEGREQWGADGTPPFIVDYLIAKVKQPEEHDLVADSDRYKQGVKNVQLYTGRPAMKFKDWAEANKQMFLD